MNMNPSDSSSSQMIDYLKDLDKRITQIENRMRPRYLQVGDEKAREARAPRDLNPNQFEIKLGEYWFAYAGIVVLLVAMSLLLCLPWNALPSFVPSLAGVAICAALVFFANYVKKSYQFLSLQLWTAAYYMGFITLIRLYYFSDSVFLEPGFLEYVLLTLLSAGLVYHAHLKQSIYLSAFSLTLVLVSGLIINTPLWTLSLFALVAVGMVYYSHQFNRAALFIYGSFAVYIAHLLWSLSLPWITTASSSAPTAVWHYTYLLIYAAILSGSIIMPRNEEGQQDFVLANALANGAPAFILFNVTYFLPAIANPLVPKALFFLVFMGLSMVFWQRLKINFSMVLFTLFAHGTISIGILQSIGAPLVFVVLIWQSLLVLGNAIWFKSRFITVSNFLLYIVLFLAYTTSSGFAGIISVSFGFVALLSARIIRAYDRHFSTAYDILINFYLAIAFISLPFALWKSLPGVWVPFAWLGVTILYYIMSVLVKSPRYRWMGHWTLTATLFYVMLMATMGMEPAYRILSFFALASVLITVSIVYTRIRRANLSTTAPS